MVMKMINASYIEVLKRTALFNGIEKNDIQTMLNCLDPKIKLYKKNELIVISGDVFESLGIILEGKVSVIKENSAGSRIMFSQLKSGEMFGEMIVFSKNPFWPATVESQENSVIFFLPKEKILGECSQMCSWHRRLIANMLFILSEKALHLNKKVEYLSIKSIRTKLCTYFIEQYKKSGHQTFNLPVKRNELAEFLNISRPSMSREMCQMRDEGLIDFHLSSIQIKDLDALMSYVD